MDSTLSRPLPAVRKADLWGWLILIAAAIYFAYAIVSFPFPANLPFLLWIPVLAAVFRSVQLGVGFLFVLSIAGNDLSIDLPGLPPLRTAHIVLLLLLGIWFVKSHGQWPRAAGIFLSTAKNRVLLLLFGWITLSMVMARLEGVTRQSIEYQLNAWLTVALTLAWVWYLSAQADERLIKMIIWLNVIVGTILTTAILATGFYGGVGLSGWKFHTSEFSRLTGLMRLSPLFWGIVFFSDRKTLGKALFAMSIVTALALSVLSALGGSRSDIFGMVVTLGFLVFLARPRQLAVFSLVVVLPILALNVGPLESLVAEETQYVRSGGTLVTGQGTRVALAMDAFETALRYPFWGTGSDLYRLHAGIQIIGQDPSGAYEAKWATNAHNAWGQVAVDHGIPAAILLAVFLAFLVRDALRLFRSTDNPLLKKFVLLFLAQICTQILFSPFGEVVLPTFTGTVGNEEKVLAGGLVTFYLNYGIFVAIEHRHRHRQVAKVGGQAA